MNNILRIMAIPAMALSVLCSCVSTKAPPPTDDALIGKGRTAWNAGSPEEARGPWSGLNDASARDRYVAYVDRYASLVKDLDDADAAPADEARALGAYERIMKTRSSFPAELALPQAIADRIARLAAARSRGLLDAGKTAQGRELARNAGSALGESETFAILVAEADTLLSTRKLEGESDAVLESARAIEDFDGKVAGYERAAASYSKTEASLSDRTKSLKLPETAPLAAMASRLRKKRQDARLEMERKLRERQYSFKDRIGEEFARVPEGDRLGSMTLEELLAYQEGIKANVEASYAEMKAFGEKYPAILDRDMLAQVDDQKKALDIQIAQVTAEIRTAKDIASRGKTVMPIMIGLFNPLPGGKPGDRKSRPAVFRGSARDGPEFWWGMTSIPGDALNDLVITMNDERTVRVFADNTKSGALIGKNGIKDLVNRGYKVGNSWPVLNAGSQLPAGRYFVEVQKGKKPAYEGEAVIYSSFIVRMR